jgi:hypothetical protein
MPAGNLAEEIDYYQRGAHQTNSALAVADRQGLFNLKGDITLPSRQDHGVYNVQRRVNGGTITVDGETYRLATDGSQSGSVASIETSQLGVYRSGVSNEVAAGVWVDQRPTGANGEIRIGYGINTEQDGIYHVITSDDWLVKFENKNREDVDVSRAAGEWERGTVTEKRDTEGELQGRVYGLDPLSGGQDSRVQYRLGEGYIYGLTIGWYGPLSTLAWLDAVADLRGRWAQRRLPLFLYRPVVDPAFAVPNRPIHVSVDNGTKQESVEARVGGRQYSVQGHVDPSPEPTFASAVDVSLPMDGTGVGPKDWYPVALFKRNPGRSGAAIGVEDVSFSAPNESLAVHSRIIEPQYLSGTEWEAPDDIAERQTAVTFDVKSDTSTRVGVETWTDSNDGGKVKPQGMAYRGDHVGGGGQFEPATGDLAGDLRFPVVREVPTVIFARTRSATGDDVDVLLKIQEVGA